MEAIIMIAGATAVTLLLTFLANLILSRPPKEPKEKEKKGKKK